jgi:hypothetical protein
MWIRWIRIRIRSTALQSTLHYIHYLRRNLNVWRSKGQELQFIFMYFNKN